MTDLPQFVPLMDHNINDNAASIKGTIQAATLTWGTAVSENIPSVPHMVLLADCIYYEEVGTFSEETEFKIKREREREGG